MKKVLFLGASPTQLPPIRYALDQGHKVYTCDYLPDNPGHHLAHKSFIVSTTDKEAVLKLARELAVDGVVAYASDPAAPTAAFVAEKMQLPGNPYQSVLSLVRKDLFRVFLKTHGFNVPRSQSFYEKEQARVWKDRIGIPCFIKPVDSSGSKGVTCLTKHDGFDQAFDHALAYSREKMVVIEEQISRSKHQIAGDGFIVNGKLVFRCWADEHFDSLCNGLVPIGESFPTQHNDHMLEIAHAESQRLLSLLDMKNGALNFDFIFTEDGEFYFLELGPRNGGCLIPEVIKYATGVDLIKYTVDAALGLACNTLEMKEVDGFWASYMVHSLEDGEFKELQLSKRIMSRIVEQDIWVKVGDQVEKYLGANHILGTMILRFESMREMIDMMDSMETDICVVVQ